jgi:hypothetical protein
MFYLKRAGVGKRTNLEAKLSDINQELGDGNRQKGENSGSIVAN